MTEAVTEPKTEQITVRLTDDEKKKASVLADLLYVHGKLDEPSVAGAMRASLHFTVNEIKKDLEAQRLGAKRR